MIPNNKNENGNKIIQKNLNKLISEEWFAGQMYKLFSDNLPKNNSNTFNKLKNLLIKTSEDELEDHYKNLILFAKNYNFYYPCCYNEFKKFAGKKDVEAFNNFKQFQDLNYYVKLAIESEQRAIKSYKETISQFNLNPNIINSFLNLDFMKQDFLQTIQNNYYDEIEHSSDFNFLNIETNIV